MNWKDIEQFTQPAHYSVHQSWKYLEETLEGYSRRYGLDIDPEFQRGHVWTEKQQIAYVEFKLRGGEGSDIILFNGAGWLRDGDGPMVLVDGKQRLEAVRRFMRNDLKVLGHYKDEFEGIFPWSSLNFIFKVNNLPTMKHVLKWYLELNSGGTPHTQEELDKVRKMYEEAKK